MAKQITDDEDRLKRQARRRLIGAVALTTAIVVVLPMVLDNEPKQVGQDIELRIPNKDKVAEFAPKIDLPPATVPVAALPASSVVAASAVVSSPVSQVVAAPVIVPAPVAPVAAIAPDTKPAPSPAKTPAVAPEHKPDQARHDTKSEHAKHDAKPSQVKPGAKPAGAAHTEQGQSVPQSGFIVQVGAFANADTAHSWQKNLVQQGFKAYTEKVGDKTRVRIGPYSTRDAANKARHKLEAKGLHSNVVELN